MELVVKAKGGVLGALLETKKTLGRDDGGISKQFAERTDAPPLSLFFSKALGLGDGASSLGPPHVAPSGHRQGSPRAKEGPGLQERFSSPPTRFSFPSLIFPAEMGFILRRTLKRGEQRNSVIRKAERESQCDRTYYFPARWQELIKNEQNKNVNQQLVDIIEKVKPEIRLWIEKCNTVKMWVQLLIPRIEDGNNFGVSIQQETVAELRTVESEAASYLDQISRYYITRAKLVSKIAKYPHVEDYRRTVTEIDEKEYISLRLIISELRNQYVTLHDMILKNIEKSKRPRSSNAETLY
ncbi:proteasome activator 28-like [Trachypithecus francoisi]|uniref:proteasome activator 28-like n=1 Tax=Trachypithecus francoisi TaxID=54180 RepID=UPI00141B515E|nr:proteasome activator 28-like [Trachypithecus francoisi]